MRIYGAAQSEAVPIHGDLKPFSFARVECYKKKLLTPSPIIAVSDWDPSP
jgi:hypothetical protein